MHRNLTIEDDSGSRNLHPKYYDPFEINRKLDSVSYQLELSVPTKNREIHDKFHASILKPFIVDEFNRTSLPPSLLHSGDKHKEYEAENFEIIIDVECSCSFLSNRKDTVVTNTSVNQKQTSSTVRNYLATIEFGSISQLTGMYCSVQYGLQIMTFNFICLL